MVHDIDIPLNPRVLSYVQLFTGRLKGYLEEGLGRGAHYLPMIQEVFRAEGLPLDLAYVPLDRERVQAKRPLESEGQGDLAVHARHRAGERSQARLVYRRAVRPRESDARGGQVSEDLARNVRGLASGARVLQRRARPCAARHEALGTRRLLEADARPRDTSRARRETTCR